MPRRDPQLSHGAGSTGRIRPSPPLHRVASLRAQRARARRVPNATSDSAYESRPFPSKNARNLRIAIFHLGFFYSGGGEKLVLEEIRGLRALGHEVDCYAPYVDREGCYPDVKEIAEILPLLPPPPRWLPMKAPLWVLLSCLLIPLMARRFRRYDVLFGANQPGPWYAFVVGSLLRKPYVVYLAQAIRLLHPRREDLENGIRIREGDHRFLMALKATGGRLIDWADRLSVRRSSLVLPNGLPGSHWLK